MTSGFWGADAGELRALAKDFDQKASQLQGLLSTLTVEINRTQAWGGPDAEFFRQQWNTTHRTSLQNANSVLTAASTALVKNAGEQEQASADDGSGGPGSGGGPGGSGPGGSGPGGGTPENPGTPGTDDDLLRDLLQNPALLNTRELFDSLGVVDGANALAQLRLLGEFGSLDDALRFSKFAGRFDVLNDFLAGHNWASAAQGLSSMLPDGAMAAKLGSAAEFLGSAGKVLGPAGVVLGVVGVGTDISEGNYARAGYDGVATGLGFAALVTPPPADLILGAAAGTMALGGLLYDHVPVFHDAVDGTITAVGDGAKAIGDGAAALAHGAEDFADDVADKAKDLWPF
ncbi:hypothetical protein B7R22_07500 [Subtercola boreus]|uniref:WXG100 family type VII secretion target n=1 Tax=Subtercola boreus TaxID=120213 RepID=A0A3E0W0F4_9MICO|nr:WXG100 family type VII secretion target [Subtercola boreus]RFA15048.1 hypothetical protein B7R22_07500 [Subtercola boreus]